MPQAIEALPDDPNALKAMLLAERARNERLVQIIKEMQRHRFGRRAETLPEDQMLLALEDVEQTKAGDAAAALEQTASQLNIPLKVIRDVAADGREKYQSRLVLVRPDQFVAWTGDETAPASVLLRAAGVTV